MVVARRAPVVAPMPMSRANSTQEARRLGRNRRKSKLVDAAVGENGDGKVDNGMFAFSINGPFCSNLPRQGAWRDVG